MALRASGRSSHTVATLSVRSIVRTGESNGAHLSHVRQANPCRGGLSGHCRRRAPHGVLGSPTPTMHPKEVHLHTFNADGSAELAGPQWLRDRRAAGVAGVGVVVPAHRERGSLALHAHRRARSGRVRPGHRRPGAPARGGRDPERSGGLRARPAVGTGAGPQRVPPVLRRSRAAARSRSAGATMSPAGRRWWAACRWAATHWSASTTRTCPTRCSSMCPPAWCCPTRSSSSIGATATRRTVARAQPSSPGPASASATGPERRLVEVYVGPTASGGRWWRPVTELQAGDGGLPLVRLAADPERLGLVHRPPGRPSGDTDSVLRTFTVGLGGDYDRVRADVSVVGRGARSEILSTYLGTGSQVHDIRTLQDHVAPRTNSELLCQGAVAGTSRSVYSGLIRVHRGRRPLRRAADQPQPGPRRGCARRLGPESGHLGERREVLACLHRRPDRRGPALLH